MAHQKHLFEKLFNFIRRVTDEPGQRGEVRDGIAGQGLENNVGLAAPLHLAELCGNFGAAKLWENYPATAAGYALFVVAPEPENFHHSLVIEHLADQTTLNIDAA